MLRKEFTIKWKIYICTWIHKYQYTNTRIFSVRNPWHISSDNLSAVVQFLTTRVSSQLILSSEVSVSLLLIVEENIKGYIEHIQSIALQKKVQKQTDQRTKQARLEIKPYDEYDWAGLLKGILQATKIRDVMKHLSHHQICLPGAKEADIVSYIAEHIYHHGKESDLHRQTGNSHCVW